MANGSSNDSVLSNYDPKTNALILAKRFALAGPARFEFRLEAFTLRNRANCRAPNGTRSQAGFGTNTATDDPRQLQLGFKLLW